jgi:hypothetical protein
MWAANSFVEQHQSSSVDGESPEVKTGASMRIVMGIVGVLLVVFGSVWFLQGINVLPGSFMSGQTRWAVYGGLAVAAGLILLGSVARKRRPNPS